MIKITLEEMWNNDKYIKLKCNEITLSNTNFQRSNHYCMKQFKRTWRSIVTIWKNTENCPNQMKVSPWLVEVVFNLQMTKSSIELWRAWTPPHTQIIIIPDKTVDLF